ncbi:Hpt domain-containing protein [Sphingosinicella rhizophila]|uniref:Hpt domain-containing protein n=1 Tax=Sphingosinicella rhizophila TaxID=3050082 RepID=A0ABU3QBC8_9SPHN|nr:Hpt domain-containing protein [Sphingosinicella sp. GR2756]MDT9600676.1 Hpt domain-containing protein [Sphingosinicella sp. GR2756]
MNTFDERMEQLQTRFRLRAVADRERLLAALAASDLDEIRCIAHGLSGSGGVFGFTEISKAAERVELAVDEGGMQVVRDEAATLLGALAALAQPL